MAKTLSRRTVIRSGFVALGSGALLLNNPLARALETEPRHPGGRRWPVDSGRRLVVVQLRGGNDGLNTVVPYSDPRYRSLRPTLALDDGLVPLTDGLALHPALAPLAAAWSAGELAVVRGVGYPGPDLSHFRSEAIWYTADPESASGPGWLGRWADASATPPPALLTSIGAIPSPATVGALTVPAAVRDPDTFGFDLVVIDPADSAMRRELIRGGFARSSDTPGAAAFAAATGLAVDALIDLVGTVPTQEEPPVPYPDSTLAADLVTAARLLDSDLGARVIWVTTGGFDTHAAQAETHAALLGGMAESLAAFRSDLDVRGLAERTAVVVWSEFGRRPAENGSRGTDHGTASNVFLLGRRLNGGLHGPPVDLSDLDSAGNLRYSVDFRSVYASLLGEHLAIDPGLVGLHGAERLGLFF